MDARNPEEIFKKRIEENRIEEELGMSDDSLMKKSIPTLLNAIEWPKESIPKLVQ